MARENINAGAATLAAMSQNVAQMGDVRNKSNALMMEYLNNLTNGLQAWQKGYDERKRAKWAQAFEEAKFAEQQRVNDSNIELAQQQLAMEKEKLPYWKKYHNALAWNANASANAQHFNTQDKKAQIDYSKRQALATSPQPNVPTNTQGVQGGVNNNPLTAIDNQTGWLNPQAGTNAQGAQPATPQIQNGVVTAQATSAGAIRPNIQIKPFQSTIVAER